MGDKEKAIKITEECLNELFQHSSPSITWSEYVEKYKDTKIQGYERHYLPQEEFNTIYNKHKKKVPRGYQNAFAMEMLSYGPTSNKQLAESFQ